MATVAGVAAAAGGLVAGPGAGSAAAAPVSRTLNYTCSVQAVSQRAAVTIDADVSRSAVVGKPTRRFAIHATSQVSDAGTTGLNWIGVKTVEGTVDADVRVTAGQDGARLTVPFTVPRTRVPESGPFDVKGTGTAPSRTFHHPGKAEISVGDLVLHVVPRDANGKVNPGRTDVPCTLDPGQNPVLASFDITRAGTPSGSEPSGDNGGSTGGSGGKAPAGTADPGAGAAKGGGHAEDGKARPAASGPTGSAHDADSAHGAKGSAHRGDNGAESNGTADGSTSHSGDPSAGPSVSTATTADQDTKTPLLLAAGAAVAGLALLIAAAVRTRSRAR
ncbi:DUF6801 domain-containing protein [Streptomyces sp. Ru73]|uniref:DUF6801 domain-containing protein n=1 Tax=Streptomyces sp. Ru73 TaxID=2080748 RepID=UPI0011B011A6|nr:DUF6801 domain-containing protein [Streptomyces sp. Ru73]